MSASMESLERITTSLRGKARSIASILALSAASTACVGDRCCEITAPVEPEPLEAQFTYLAAEFAPAGFGQPQEGQMYDLCVRNNAILPGSESDNIDFCYWTIRSGDVGFQPGFNSLGFGDADVYSGTNNVFEITTGEFAGGRILQRLEAVGPNGEKTDFRVGSATHVMAHPAIFSNWDQGLGAAVRDGEIVPEIRLWNGQTLRANDDGTPHVVSIEGAPTKAYTFFTLTQAPVVRTSGEISRDSAVALVGESAIASRESQFVPREGMVNDTIYLAASIVPLGWAEPRTSSWMTPAADVRITHMPEESWDPSLTASWRTVTPEGEFGYTNAQIGLPFGIYQWQQIHSSSEPSLVGQTMENRFFIANLGGGRVPTLELHKDHTGDALESHLAVTVANFSTGLPGMFRNGQLVAGATNGQGSFTTRQTMDTTLPYNPTLATTQAITTFWELKTDSIIDPYSIVSKERFREVAQGGN